MQCTRLSSPDDSEQGTSLLTSGTVISEEEAVHYASMEHQPIKLIPDCLEHIFKYLSTSDKGRVSQVL